MTEYKLKITNEELLELLRKGKCNNITGLVYPCEMDAETGEYNDTGECGEVVTIIEVV